MKRKLFDLLFAIAIWHWEYVRRNGQCGVWFLSLFINGYMYSNYNRTVFFFDDKYYWEMPYLPKWKWDCPDCMYDGRHLGMDRYLSCGPILIDAELNKYIFVFGNKGGEYYTSNDKYYEPTPVLLDQVLTDNGWKEVSKS